MKKSLLLTTIAMLVFSLNANTVFANSGCQQKQYPTCPSSQDESFGPPPPPFKMSPEQRDKVKKEHERRKAKMDARLNLTQEQKNKIEENRLQDRKKMKPIFDQVREKRSKIETINASALSQEEKSKQIETIKCELKDLRVQLNKLREENMKNFESILTPKQRLELEKIKKEHHQDMEKRMKKHGDHPPFPDKE